MGELIDEDDCEVCVPFDQEWIFTYGDLVTLLLCFFILLFSTCTYETMKFKIWWNIGLGPFIWMLWYEQLIFNNQDIWQLLHYSEHVICWQLFFDLFLLWFPDCGYFQIGLWWLLQPGVMQWPCPFNARLGYPRSDPDWTQIQIGSRLDPNPDWFQIG